jgi:hypothetical protein
MQKAYYGGVVSLLMIALLGICLLLPSLALAKQITFKHVATPKQHSFAYAWRMQDASFTLNFTLSAKTFTAMPNTRPAFSNDVMQREIEVALLKYAKTLDPRRGRVEIKRRGKVIEYGVSSPSESTNQDIMQMLKSISAEAKQQYLSDHFYTYYSSPLGVSAVKHDHAKYAKMSADSLTPVVAAIKGMQINVNDPREFIQIALNWMQSIPYDTLENRVTSNGAGYVSPKDLLVQNQGDCDSKATFLAALIRAYSSSVQQKMVLLPQHALLAIAIRPDANEKTVSQDGIEYVLLEAAGPGYFDIGKVADSTWMDIINRQYSLDRM